MHTPYRFEALISPTTADQFFNEYYENQPLRIARGQADFYADLLSLDRVEAWLASGAARYPDVLMVQHEIDVAKSEYVRDDDRIDAELLYRRFAEGATVVINNLQLHLPELAALCRASEWFFSMPFQTNIYLSPPNAQGFRTHYDTHDVFVLQIAGSKNWSLYDSKIVLPLPGQDFDKDRDTAGPKTDDFVLAAGDLLYCPRGLMHDATSTDEASLHITFGLLGKTRAELLVETVAAACLNDPELRRTVPRGFARLGFDRTELRATVLELLRRTAAADSGFDAALDRMVENFVATRRPDLDGHLTTRLAPAEVGLEHRLAPRPDLIWRIKIDEAQETLTVHLPGADITLPSFTAAAVAFLLETPAFYIRDLPGDIDDEARLVLARRFLREGVLVRAPEPASRAIEPAAQWHAAEPVE